MDRSSYEGLDRPTTPPPSHVSKQASIREASSEHHRAAARRGHGRGTPLDYVADRKIEPAFRQGQPGRTNGNAVPRPANQSLITDVLQVRPHPCNDLSPPDPQQNGSKRAINARSALD